MTMPRRPKRPCTHPGCPALTEAGGPCPKHKKDRDKERGTAAQRGYDRRWRKYRRRFLDENPLCEECNREGCDIVATVVHHHREVSSRDDPLFWEPRNHAALCRECHERVHKRKR
jgi:5-methylcytosine-specific restriction protein A